MIGLSNKYSCPTGFFDSLFGFFREEFGFDNDGEGKFSFSKNFMESVLSDINSECLVFGSFSFLNNVLRDKGK